MENLFQLLEQAGRNFGSRTAVVSGDIRVSYQEYFHKTAALARGFSSLGISKNTKVALIFSNVPEFLYSFFALAGCGAVSVPVNPGYLPYELDYILRDSETQFVVTLDKYMKRHSPCYQRRPDMKIICAGRVDDSKKLVPEREIVDFNGLLNCREQGAPEHTPKAHQTACIIYTNAQNGYPLGAELTHGSMLFGMQKSAEATRVTGQDTFLGALPLFHAFGITAVMLMAAGVGASLVLMERFMPDKVMTTLEKEKVTFFVGVPAMFAMLSLFASRSYNLGHLSFCISGGAPLTRDIQEKFENTFRIPIIEGYGLTECSPVVSVTPVPGHGKQKMGSIGLPLPGITARVVDEQGREAPPESEGELWVTGPNVMKSYYKQPEVTKKFLTDGWLHTGDYAKIDKEGYIFITGIKKRMLLNGGFNVYCAEVERVLKEHPAVKEATLTGKPDAVFYHLPHAQVILKSGADAGEKELAEFCKQRLVSYKVPKTIDIVKGVE